MRPRRAVRDPEHPERVLCPWCLPDRCELGEADPVAQEERGGDLQGIRTLVLLPGFVQRPDGRWEESKNARRRRQHEQPPRRFPAPMLPFQQRGP